MIRKRTWLYGALLLLFVLHKDLWFWDDPTLVLGLPVGLAYHLGLMLAVTVVMVLLVRRAWPDHLEVQEEVVAATGPEDVAPTEPDDARRHAPEGTVPRTDDPGASP